MFVGALITGNGLWASSAHSGRESFDTLSERTVYPGGSFTSHVDGGHRVGGCHLRVT